MAWLWVLGLSLLWSQGCLSVHLHRNLVGSDTPVKAHHRSIHTTEGHKEISPHHLPDLSPTKFPLYKASSILPVSLNKVATQNKAVKSNSVATSRKKREHRVDSAVQSSAAVLGELGKILKDDENEKKRIPPDVKRQATLKPNDTVDEGGDRKQQTFEDWLRDEYFRNMALSIATVKKKRSSFDARRKRSSKHEDAAGVAQEAKLRLQSLENAVLADALTEIVSRHDDTEEDNGHDSDLVARRLAQAYYLERLRGAVQRIEEEAAEKESWGAFDEEPEEVAEEEPGNEEDQYTYEKKNGNSIASVLDEKGQTEEDLCPTLGMLMSDCSSLEEVLGEGEMSQAVRRACNKHEVCYSCGEVFGLSSSSCDRVFLEDVSSVCRSCSERALGQLLIPLRDQRVFYKRSVPPLCYRAPCVQRYLEEHY